MTMVGSQGSLKCMHGALSMVCAEPTTGRNSRVGHQRAMPGSLLYEGRAREDRWGGILFPFLYLNDCLLRT